MNKLTICIRSFRFQGIFYWRRWYTQYKKEYSCYQTKNGLLSQRPYPLPTTIFKNVAYASNKSVRDKKLIEYSVEKNLQEVGLWEEVKGRLNSPAVSLSIGQQQSCVWQEDWQWNRASYLLMSLHRPLNPISSKIIEDLFKKLKSITQLFWSPYLKAGHASCSNVVFMSNGEIIEQDARWTVQKSKTDKLKEYMWKELMLVAIDVLLQLTSQNIPDKMQVVLPLW